MRSLLILSFDLGFALLGGILLLLSSLLLLETLAFLSTAGHSQHLDREPVNAAIVIPAHDEEVVLAQTLTPLQSLPYPVIVVADNCHDATAAISRELGAIVLERENAQQRGKGYAMDFGVEFLRRSPPDVVLFLDADCQIAPHEVQQLVHYSAQQQRPVQAAYVMQVPPQPSSKHRVSAFAFRFKNQVRLQGLSALGGPIVLTGSGMAFPWHCIEHARLASGAIVEDMKLGIDLAIAGRPVQFYAGATVTSVLPQHTSAVNRQRTRWEHGHLQSIGIYVPRLLWQALRQRRGDLLLLAWDLCVPPLSLMVLAWATSFGAVLLAYCWGRATIAFWLLTSAGSLLLSAILLAWSRIGQRDLPLADLLRIPLYIISKIPLYLRFVTARQQSWERTERDIKPRPKTVSLSSKN